MKKSRFHHFIHFSLSYLIHLSTETADKIENVMKATELAPIKIWNR